MDYVYKLNLPPLTEIFREDALEILNIISQEPIYEDINPNDIIKSDCLSINNFTMSACLHFFKPTRFVGRVHSDTVNPSNHSWGINWIHGADSILNYWTLKDFLPIKMKVDELGSLTWNYPTNVLPNKSYYMPPGAYLVNAHMPHQPVSLGPRHCFSLRAPESFNIPWEEIVEKFRHLII